MTQIFTEDGTMIPLTAIQVGPCPITQIKTESKDGYNAVQIGFETKKEKNTTRPLLGHFAKSGVAPQRVLKEVRVDSTDGLELGKHWDVSFDEGERVDIAGNSKGRGFQGGMKRHGWKGGEESHGSMFHRRIGAIAPGTGLGRIFPGKTLPGHMGTERVVIQNMEIVKVDKENNLIFVRGGIPGPNGSFVYLKETTKNKK